MKYTKTAPLCELQERHKVQIDGIYRNNQACAIFIHFISELQVRLHNNLSKCKFYSIQKDGSTDSANKENKLFLVVYFDPNHSILGTIIIILQFFNLASNMSDLWFSIQVKLWLSEAYKGARPSGSAHGMACKKECVNHAMWYVCVFSRTSHKNKKKKEKEKKEKKEEKLGKLIIC